MKLDWKKFKYEVPTEPRSIVTFGAGYGGALLEYEPGSQRELDGSLRVGWCSYNLSVWIYVERNELIDQLRREEQWSESAEINGWTHWAYVDPSAIAVAGDQEGEVAQC